jgi:flavin reductase (DIM6/NTAB) family NADH-FMN oxidoreductase RutF
MYFDLLGPQAPRLSIFNAIVAPRPIAWVSTVDEDGVANLAPFSYFNLLTSNPPTTIFSCTAPGDRREKDTVANVRSTGEFVINIVSHELLHAMHASSATVPHGVDEFALAGVARTASANVRPPRVSAAPAALECRAIQFLEIEAERAGDSRCTAVIGRVVGLHVAPEFLDANGRFDSVRARLMARLGGHQYAELGTVTELASLVHATR